MEDKIRILCVDDEIFYLKSCERALRKISNAVTLTAGNPSEALSMIPEYRPQIVISDFQMPEMNGYDFLEKLRKEYPHIKNILMSGNALLIQKPISEVADVLLEKPFENDDLVCVVEALISQISQKPL